MKIEIITIGDEILIGQIIDTNSTWMATELTKTGFEVVAITSVGDLAGDITKAIDMALGRADVVLMTGGIGPTKDDITKKTLCEYFGTELVFDDSVLDNIKEIFRKKQNRLNELTRNQAYVPKDCTVIQNRVGTAPLLWFEKEKKVLVSMPGVPFEMKNAMSTEIIPRLIEHYSVDNYKSVTFSVSGITESALAMMLGDFEDNLPANSALAYLPSYGLIRLRLSIRSSSNGDYLLRLAEELKQLVTEYLVDEVDRPIEELLGKILVEKGLTLAIAESCTGGEISHRITSVSGSSEYFIGGVVSYANGAKQKILGVRNESLQEYGAVSAEVVEEMVAGVAELLGSDCAIAVSGIAGPNGGSEEKPVGTTWVSTKYGNNVLTEKYQFSTSRAENISRAANMALLQLIKMVR